jgi:zinc transport system substrate-binding protein
MSKISFSIRPKLFRILTTILIISFFAALLSACEHRPADQSPQRRILVSIEPQQFFVEKIAGDNVVVNVLVPPGGNPHAFEPTPKQMLNAGSSDIWFRIGESFETRASDVLKSHNSSMMVIDTREGIQLISLSGHTCCHSHTHTCRHDDQDTHIWLSPRLAKIQAKTIAKALKNRYPECQEQFEKNLNQFLTELDELDKELAALFSQSKAKAILVSHPAFGYLCKDYGLTQLSIEFEGKDPSPQQLTQLLQTVKNLEIKRVFTQEQYQNKGALLIAKALNAEVFSVDPYSRDYLNNLKEIAKLFANYSTD